jgi:hypothetical protein
MRTRRGASRTAVASGEDGADADGVEGGVGNAGGRW